MTLKLDPKLELDRCPHCSVANPHMQSVHRGETKDHAGRNGRMWMVYVCGNCGGLVTASSTNIGQAVLEIFPDSKVVSNDLPDRAKAYLQQAVASIHAPSGAVMLAASSVDAMLKEKGYTSGSLYSRIDKAVEDNLLTSEMAKWAHEIRLDANDERHADDDATLPSPDDAKKVVDFAQAIAEYLYVLPSRIERALEG